MIGQSFVISKTESGLSWEGRNPRMAWGVHTITCCLLHEAGHLVLLGTGSSPSLPRSLVTVKSNANFCTVAARQCLGQSWPRHSRALCSVYFLGEAEWSQSSRRGRGRTVKRHGQLLRSIMFPSPCCWDRRRQVARGKSGEEVSRAACQFGNLPVWKLAQWDSDLLKRSWELAAWGMEVCRALSVKGQHKHQQ